MNPLDALNILEKKIEVLVYQIETLKKENNEIKNLYQIEREKTAKLSQDLAMLKQEKQSFNYSKNEIKHRIEDLITKLTTKTPVSNHDNFSSNDASMILKDVSGISSGIDMVDDEVPGYNFDS